MFLAKKANEVTIGQISNPRMRHFSLVLSLVVYFSLRWLATAAPVNDNFTNAIVLTGTTNAINGTNAGATFESGEPMCQSFPPFFTCPNYSYKSVWYDYTPSQNGILELNLNGSTNTVYLQIFTGINVTNLSKIGGNYHTVKSSANGAPINYFAKLTRYVVTSGTKYHIAADTLAGQEGKFKLAYAFTAAPPNDAFLTNTTILSPVTTIYGSTYGATIETNEPGVITSDTSSWWQWEAKDPTPIMITTAGSSIGTSLEIYTGESIAGLTFIDGNGGFDFSPYIEEAYHASINEETSRVLLQPVAGQNYKLQVVSGQNLFTPEPSKLTLNFTTLAIEDIISLVRTNSDYSVTVKISNFSGRTTGALRIKTIAAATYRIADEIRYDLNLIASLNAAVKLLKTNSLVAPGFLTGASSSQITLAGTYPAATISGNVRTNWNIYAVLEESVGGSWIQRDLRLVAPQLYSTLDGLTGGGVATLGSGLVAGQFQFGSFKIQFAPATDLHGRGGWKINEVTDTNYYPESAAPYGLPAGANYTLTFLPVTGFLTPTNRTLTVTANQTNTVAILYTNLVPKASAAKGSNGALLVTFNASTGLRYALEQSSNLLTWIPLQTNQVGTNGVISFTNNAVKSTPRAYYRTRWVP